VAFPVFRSVHGVGLSIVLLLLIAVVLFFQYGYPKIRGYRKKDRTVLLK